MRAAVAGVKVSRAAGEPGGSNGVGCAVRLDGAGVLGELKTPGRLRARRGIGWTKPISPGVRCMP